jgi:hypothetical protein
MEIPRDAVVGYVRESIQKRHPEIEIKKPHIDGAELDDDNLVVNWTTRTGSRAQVTVRMDNTLCEEEWRGEIPGEPRSDAKQSLRLEHNPDLGQEQESEPKLIIITHLLGLAPAGSWLHRTTAHRAA